MATGESDTSVKVAVRVRPQNAREQIDMCRVCTYCTPDTPQIVLGKDKAFTYDYVFDTTTHQEQIYTSCIQDLVNGCFDGYNATVLAYGQTGSGKTYTMGTGFDITIPPSELGMIPRAVGQIFSSIEQCKRNALEKDEPIPHFEVQTQFLELYNEEIIDLFEEQNKGKLRIHEDGVGSIYVAGATELTVTSEEETLACLKRGALSRTVGSTNMNAQSSRSHAIFSLHLVHQRLSAKSLGENQAGGDSSIDSVNNNNEDTSANTSDWETLKAKFHFVDLAGSERLKRTGATGERAKEGISINCGLLALGNVISALGDKAKKGSHVPYRDSKLTRLLQDSLGGNSRTLMIACISPTDRDFMETLNTLKYSNRARNIKNKVTVNQDKMSQQLTVLRSKIQQLEVELQEFKSGRMVVSGDGSVVMNDMASEITMLRTENDKIRLRIKAIQQVVESQSSSIASLTAERDCLMMGHQDESTGQVVAGSNKESSSSNFAQVIQGYITQIEELKGKLILNESMARQSQPKPAFQRLPNYSEERSFRRPATSTDMETDDLLKLAKNNIEKLKEKGKKDIGSTSKSRSSHKKSSDGPVSSEADSSLEESSDEGSDDSEETTTLHVSSSDESESDHEETASLASSIAELSSEINLKQQLVDQLEKAQRNIYTMKAQYEEKMQVLQHQIKSIESERDRVLRDISTQRSHDKNDEKVKGIKSKYERQLNDLKTELKTLKSAKREHAKAIRKNAQHERDLKTMKNELLEMKKQRVKLLNRMREDANQRKMDEARRTKEIRQLQKERRTKEHKIQVLESDARRKEVVLKRRQEELAALRRNNRFRRDRHALPSQSSLESSQTHPLSRVELGASNSAVDSTIASSNVSSSETTAGYLAGVVLRRQNGSQETGKGSLANKKRRMSSIFSSESAKRKWRNLEKKILDATMKRRTMANLSKDMDTWIEKRDKLSQKVDDLRKQKQSLLQSGDSEVVSSEVVGIEEDMDSLTANVEYVQENIVELQNDLIAVDDVKCDGDTIDAHSLISSCSPKEAKYLLEHLLDRVLNLGVKASQMESDVKSLEARLKASEQSAEILQSLSSPQVSTVSLPLNSTKFKHLAQCRDLYSSSALAIENSSKCSILEEVDGTTNTVNESNKKEAKEAKSPKNHRHVVNESTSTNVKEESRVGETEEKNQSKVAFTKDNSPESNVGDDKIDDKVTSRRRGGSGGSHDYKRKAMKKRSNNSTADLHSSSASVSSCPPSPNLSGKLSRSMGGGSDGGVWSRLTGSANASADSSKGVFQVEKSETRRSGAGKLLQCTHTASGHSASVLSVCSTQNYLFSASQDRTVKIWNLKTGTELLTLDKHFSYVRCVRFCPKNNLIFTASQSLIKLWDMRHHRARCIKTFGLNSANGVSVGAEYAVQDLLISPSGDILYSASGNFINIWDLKKSAYLGRFVGHNGALCALALKGNLMATGSRDRLIKLYDLESVDTSGIINQPSICTLYPPHYDAVLSLALYKDLMFSSCGVTIKQWDIKERTLKQALDGAHSPGNTINSLAIFNSPLTPLLVSGCKGGVMKLWNPETCAHNGEITSHKGSINSISTNGTCIFTASSDKTVRIWRPIPQDS